LNVGSQSTGHRFRLFAEHKPAPFPVVGTFNAYGLSSTATVPWF
jgi:CRISPR-associated endonuclease Csy4